jgi:hypothetical protein
MNYQVYLVAENDLKGCPLAQQLFNGEPRELRCEFGPTGEGAGDTQLPDARAPVLKFFRQRFEQLGRGEETPAPISACDSLHTVFRPIWQFAMHKPELRTVAPPWAARIS